MALTSLQHSNNSANLAAYDILGNASPDGASMSEVFIRVECSAASTAPGSGVQVSLKWNDGTTAQQDDTIIGLDTLGTSSPPKKVQMWTGLGTTVTLEGNLTGDGHYAIDWALTDVAFPIP